MFEFHYEKELQNYLLKNGYFENIKLLGEEFTILSKQIDIVGKDEECIYLIELKSNYISLSDFHNLKKRLNDLMAFNHLKKFKGLLLGTRISKKLEQEILNEDNISYKIIDNVIYNPKLRYKISRKYNYKCDDLEVLALRYFSRFQYLEYCTGYEIQQNYFAIFKFDFRNGCKITSNLKRHRHYKGHLDSDYDIEYYAYDKNNKLEKVTLYMKKFNRNINLIYDYLLNTDLKLLSKEEVENKLQDLSRLRIRYKG